MKVSTTFDHRPWVLDFDNYYVLHYVLHFSIYYVLHPSDYVLHLFIYYVLHTYSHYVLHYVLQVEYVKKKHVYNHNKVLSGAPKVKKKNWLGRLVRKNLIGTSNWNKFLTGSLNQKKVLTHREIRRWILDQGRIKCGFPPSYTFLPIFLHEYVSLSTDFFFFFKRA